MFFLGANNAQTQLNRESTGVMTELEVTALSLFGAKAVMLSACDTGLVEVKKSAGLYGLSSVLVLAGG